MFVQVEVSQARGRPDAVVHTDQVIYLLEFKLNDSAQAALEQIKANDYAALYQSQSKAVRGVGFRFSSEHKAVDQWQAEDMS